MSNHIDKDEILLIGAGKMAEEYAKILRSLNVPFTVIGRGEESAKSFYERTGIPVETGGLEEWTKQQQKIPETAIVSVNVEKLANATLHLLERGVRKVLVEKPGGLDLGELFKVAATAEVKDAEVYIAFNRRFYASTIRGQEFIQEDGGVTSFHFEFSEWSHLIGKNNHIDPKVKKNWFLANSSHVVDMAFFLGGKPIEMKCYKKGSLEWHPNSSIFAGAGISESGALFSYHANWEAPGNWKIEILTPSRRLIYNPLEKLYVQRIGTTLLEEVNLDDIYDKTFKPGLYRQVHSFLNFPAQSSLLPVSHWLQQAAKFSRISY